MGRERVRQSTITWHRGAGGDVVRALTPAPLPSDGRGGGELLWGRNPGRRSFLACPYMLFLMHLTSSDFSAHGLPFHLSASRRSFTQASVASRSERAPRGADRPSASRGRLRPPLAVPANSCCLASSFMLFLPRQESETAAPAQGAAVACASSFSPRTVLLDQSVAQLEPHAPSAQNSNRCQSVGLANSSYS